MEGDPIHRMLAERYGANLYLPRLDGHGIDLGDETFADITASSLMESAAQALGEAHLLGDSVILVGTSTGGTLGLYLAGIDPKISSLVFYSPNIKIYDKSAALLDDPWGLQIGQVVTGSKYHGWDASGPRKQYWTTHYQLRGLAELQALVSNTMIPQTFERVEQPAMVAYYYKSDSLQDKTVSVEAIREMFPQLGSTKKRLVVVPDAGHHVMASSLTSNDLETVEKETINFLEQVVGLSPVAPDSVVAESM
jgi:esterase/lipase